MAPLKALLLEDDLEFSEYLQEFLNSRGYAITAVPNGADGLREMMKTDFDVIVCDMVMPKVPGDVFYHAVGRIKPHLCERFVFITGMDSNPRVRKFVEDTDCILITKPFPENTLVSALNKIAELGMNCASMAGAM